MTTMSDTTAAGRDALRSDAAPAGPLRLLLEVFSSVWLGVTLLTLLFIYSSLGSALPPLRQLPAFEMTEFEWFHWWPFDLMVLLLCVNLTVTTLRRIPFSTINLGVWMIHTGIVVLAIGSVIYFSTKIEGDTPVIRRAVNITMPAGGAVELPAIPGARRTVQDQDGRQYQFAVFNVDPEWELLTGDAKGERAYSVQVLVQSPERTFLRQMIDGYPELTEDVIQTDDPNQPMQRAKNLFGAPLLTEDLSMSLALHEQDEFFIVHSWALYLRELGTERWYERPLDDLPRYNDYVADIDTVWTARQETIRPRPLSIDAPAQSDDDPLADVTFTINSYLRYAMVEERVVRGREGVDPLNPVVSVALTSLDGRQRSYDMSAFVPEESVAEEGRIRFHWARSADEIDPLRQRRPASLTFTAGDEAVALPITETLRTNPDATFQPIPGTDYSFRVESVQDGMEISPGAFIWLAIIDLKKGDDVFRRWVFSDESMPNRDFNAGASPSQAMHDAQRPLDTNITAVYTPGYQPPPVTVVAGPTVDDLGVIISTAATPEGEYIPAKLGQAIPIANVATLTINRIASHTRRETRAAIVPRERRNKDLDIQNAMVRVTGPNLLPGAQWVHYHHYPFPDANHNLRRFPYRPTVFQTADGRAFEMILSRQRMPLPAPVVLSDFEITSHVGGFSGAMGSIRDWTSIIEFDPEDSEPTGPVQVSVNNPGYFGGYAYFQAQWDAPTQSRFEGDPPSKGLNYTVLGVGNRQGVITQLAGCCIAVFGMIYAFYVKPILKRRRQQEVYAAVAARAASNQAAPPATEPELEPAAVADGVARHES